MIKILFIGRLTRDVDLKQKNKDGEKVTTFYNCVAWRGLAETCSKFLSKGKLVYIEGELHPRQYAAKDGSTKMSLDVQVESVEFLSPKSESNEEQSGADASGFTDVSSDDIPFM